MAVVKDPWNVKLPYPDRECLKCLKYPCFGGIQKCKSDFSKYGCKYYSE